MRITDVSTLLLHDPDGEAFQDATMLPPPTGARGRRVLFVEVHSDAGPVGLGWTAGLRATRAVVMDTLRETLIGKDPFDTEGLWNEMFWRVRGFGRKGVAFQAISAVDIALWDLKAKALGLPLYKLLGACHDSVPVYGSGGWTNYTEAELVREQMSYVEQGYPAIKMKIGKEFGQREREDLARLAAVRRAAGDEITLYVDANNGYTAKQAIRVARGLEEREVAWFEEPVLADDVDGLAQVARATSIPVATGEHEYTKFGFKDLLARGGADIAQPDVGRVGGVTEWLKVAHLAHAFNLPVASHAFAPIHLHLAMATPNILVVEMLGTETASNRVFFTELPQPKNGRWAPFPDRPGLGVELRPAAVNKLAVS